ncbi:MAG: phosphoglucosamine mutase [Flavobacteriaceae bacterium]|jgi:phosphomannomutase|nr:phosphoglucosamine mutase [Flavobacteriaceae bacterium]MBT3754611.1 phosphoglucosamine mutase [Flavobacteriaceae bacterium]MBT5396576.1 phosphoglucosamine mutase [Flavobacteriaceae bacterium]MBT7011196.1 phosphoglucosamine mutase [Flavobacteriaceae bacterium]MBT7320326.1 phosphoglucosamine mutase [Flavobacteriaceae bacterium]|tara:strand:+ start:239 stop:1624 length:1386 start_codon:yes stop_codon:yes gene_type:complete
MTLIKSISGIRGTIGGKINKNLTPFEAVKFGCAYGVWLKRNSNKNKLKVVIGRDARISGEMIQNFVQNSLISLGINVIDLGLSTTPTVELMVKEYHADGGIIITASHNPAEWNALKLLDKYGEFLDNNSGEEIVKISESDDYVFSEVYDLGTITKMNNTMKTHIDSVLKLDLVNTDLIRKTKLKVVIDAINSSGGIIVPLLLNELNIDYSCIYCKPTGDFQHNPEPLKENLTELCKKVVEEKADLGIAVDPDVDRLVFVCENGEIFGEENTLVACADYVLSKNPGSTVSNLSSTRGLKDVTEKQGQSYYASAVGEVNVVNKMKECNAVIGGEGNGGVIYPESHYGRDAIVGIGLFLSLLIEKNISVSELLSIYPKYKMVKEKINLSKEIDVDKILNKLAIKYNNENINETDGLKVDFKDSWVHLRKSNTEPIIRIYGEGKSEEIANSLVNQIKLDIKELSN